MDTFSFRKNVLRFTTVFVCAVFSTVVISQEDAIDPNLIKTEAITDSTVNSTTNSTTRLKSPPASAISPTINTSNSDLCTFGVAGAVQTQILGVSTGTQFTDENCERLKNAKTLYDMGMKVAAVSVMCQDTRVFTAMMHAGTPCPYDGKIGEEAKAAWMAEGAMDKKDGLLDEPAEQTAAAGGGLGALLLLLLL